MTTATPSIQKSVYGSSPVGFQGITNYSNPNIQGLVAKKLHYTQGGYHNSFGSMIESLIPGFNKDQATLMAKTAEAQRAAIATKQKVDLATAENDAAIQKAKLESTTAQAISTDGVMSNPIVKWGLIGVGGIIVLVILVKIIK